MSFITMQTRKESYNEIQEKNPVRYELILEHLEKPKTAKEIAVELYELELTYSPERNMVAPRLTELEKRGIVRAFKKKKCEYTGKTVAVYERVDSLEDMVEENMNHIPQI